MSTCRDGDKPELKYEFLGWWNTAYLNVFYYRLQILLNNTSVLLKDIEVCRIHVY